MYHKQTIQRFLQRQPGWPTNGVGFLSHMSEFGQFRQWAEELYIHPDTFTLCCMLDPTLQRFILHNEVKVYFRNWMPEDKMLVAGDIDCMVYNLTNVSVMDAI